MRLNPKNGATDSNVRHVMVDLGPAAISMVAGERVYDGMVAGERVYDEDGEVAPRTVPVWGTGQRVPAWADVPAELRREDDPLVMRHRWGQCAATTTRGSHEGGFRRCRNAAREGSAFCFMHGGEGSVPESVKAERAAARRKEAILLKGQATAYRKKAVYLERRARRIERMARR